MVMGKKKGSEKYWPRTSTYLNIWLNQYWLYPSFNPQSLLFVVSDPMLSAAKSCQSCLTLCDPIDSSPPGSPVPGILQARTLEWVALFFSNAWKWKVKVKSLSRVPLPATPMDYRLPGSSIHGIFQARVLEWGPIAFSGICFLVALKKKMTKCFWEIPWFAT